MSTAEERIERLERQVAMLLATIEAQAAKIVELKRRLAENSTNSSKPQSSDPPSTRAERPAPLPRGKRRGG